MLSPSSTRSLRPAATWSTTADVYVGGVSEQIIGRWFAARRRDVTDRVVLASKGRFTRTSQDVNAVGLSRRHLNRALNASLGRLGVETIDLYQLHASDMHTPVEETLSFLDEAVKASGRYNHCAS
jgi:aryl-alcohol dehydrogenase-like predicted oxidoreductase